MSIFDRIEIFPEIMHVKFLPASKLKSKKGELIHLGTRSTCVDHIKFTLNQEKMFDDLAELIESSSFKRLDFLSFNDLKNRQDEFCEKCLSEASYFQNNVSCSSLNYLLETFEILKDFSEKEISLNYFYLMDFLQITNIFKNCFQEMRDEKNQLCVDIITPFENMLNLKAKEISKLSYEMHPLENLKKENVKEAASLFFNSSFANAKTKTLISDQEELFVKELSEDDSYVLFEKVYNFEDLEYPLRNAVNRGHLTQDEAIFFLEMEIRYLGNKQGFNISSYVVFLALTSISKRSISFKKPYAEMFTIVDVEPDVKTIETCKSLFDTANPTFNTYEKVYDIAINL